MVPIRIPPANTFLSRNETPTVRGLTADNNNKVYLELMILWNNHYNLNFNVGLSDNSKK